MKALENCSSSSVQILQVPRAEFKARCECSLRMREYLDAESIWRQLDDNPLTAFDSLDHTGNGFAYKDGILNI